MKKQILSKFEDSPKTKIGWGAMWLGLSTIFIMPLLGIFGAILSPMITVSLGERFQLWTGIILEILIVALLVSAVTVGIRAFRKGERSWLFWLGFTPAILSTVFFIFMIVGEFIFPH
jgi:uncharacterized membrane protein YhaH (DUF805 family)